MVRDQIVPGSTVQFLAEFLKLSSSSVSLHCQLFLVWFCIINSHFNIATSEKRWYFRSGAEGGSHKTQTLNSGAASETALQKRFRFAVPLFPLWPPGQGILSCLRCRWRFRGGMNNWIVPQRYPLRPQAADLATNAVRSAAHEKIHELSNLAEGLPGGLTAPIKFREQQIGQNEPLDGVVSPNPREASRTTNNLSESKARQLTSARMIGRRGPDPEIPGRQPTRQSS